MNVQSFVKVFGHWVRTPNWVFSVINSPVTPVVAVVTFVIVVGLAIGAVEHTF